MNSSPYNPFPDGHPSHSGGERPRQQVWQEFTRAMDPLWFTVHSELRRRKPDGWRGYRCDVEVQWDHQSEQFSYDALFRDGASKRALKLTSRVALTLISCLHEAYLRFDPHLEWRRVGLNLILDEGQRRWCNETTWEYGRSIGEPGAGDQGCFGRH